MFKYLWGYTKRTLGNEHGIVPLVVGGLLAQGVGSYLGSKTKTKIDPYGNLNPEQIKMFKATAPQIQERATADPSSYQYKGQFTAPLTQGEKDVISQNSRLSAVSQPMWETMINPLNTQGELGTALNNYYKDAIYSPMLKSYQEDIAPQIEEQYAGYGGYWGGARADAVRKGYRDLYDQLTAQRSKLAYDALVNAPNVANQYADFATKSAEIQAKPRLVDQFDLTAHYDDWTRAGETSRKYIDQALNFLDIQAQTAKETRPYAAAGSALTTLGGAAGAYAGMANGITNTAGNSGMVERSASMLNPDIVF